MPLLLDPYLRSIEALEQVIQRCEDPALLVHLDEIAQRAMHAGAIQHFEFTYELAWKMMRRWLEANVGHEGIDGITRRELFRRAAEHRLIDDVDRWMGWHAARNQTAHTHDAETADEVYRAAVLFVGDARALAASLAARND
jgi:nucleotidyltransferase substrate binding protein (TIGR01987 family)